MASSCISSCVNEKVAPMRETYVNLQKRAESDAEFIRSRRYMSRNKNITLGGRPGPEVVDSISCRQLYLRSYTFSTKYQNKEESTKWFRRVKSKGGESHKRKRRGRGGGCGIRCVRWRKVKVLSGAALLSIFRRLLSCTIKPHVAHSS